MPADPRPIPDAQSAPPIRGGCGQGCGCSQAASPSEPAPLTSGVSRRSFIKTVGVSAAATSITTAGEARAAAIAGEQPADGPVIQGPDALDITLTVNGQPLKLNVEPATTLLEALRVHANLTGAKEICDRGACGGCSVIIDGQLINACMMLALDAVGTQITTIEGLAKNGKLDPVQESFVRHDALQCGYCTPGLVMACRALLNDTPKPTLDQIRRGLSGNICRCGTYTNIFNAALEASGQSPIMDQKGA
jgi:xanthine dehydrogenase YagT iron-sulfur-binding subunit